MSSWPVELFSYVFELACTDGGHTARVLSLTSRHFREIVRPFLYQSLVLSTPEKFATLLERVEQVPPHLRRIKHLFLCLDHNSHPNPEHGCSSETPLIIKGLRLAAPTLQSLCLVASYPQSSTPLLSYLFRIPFPHLEELAIAGLYSYSFHPLNFPRLRRLHFAGGNRNPSGLFQLGALDEAFPELTHLRVDGISRAPAFAAEVECALRNARKSRDSGNNNRPGQSDALSETMSELSLFGDAPIRLPTRLEKIYIQCATPSISAGMSRSSSRPSSIEDPTTKPLVPSSTPTDDRQFTMMERLIKLDVEFGIGHSRHTPVQLVVTMAEGSQQSMKNPGTLKGVATKLKHDWLDRLNGGDGAWFHQ